MIARFLSLIEERGRVRGKYLFTSESVSEGHPDKICDQVSDAVLDALLAKDAQARVACEALVKTGLLVLAGEVSSVARVDYGQLARRVVADIGYNDLALGFDASTCGVLVAIEEQSQDIAVGVNEGSGLDRRLGAGDQGMMFGYACEETPELMPATISYAHQLLRELAAQRHSGKVEFLRPDAKSQVTAIYEDNRMVGIDSVVISTQHREEVSRDELKEYVVEECIRQVIPAELLSANTDFFVNETGSFTVGGPHGDCGLTGRKIIVDTYGGHGSHGGGAFSGKDPTKVDRSASYMARYIAKNLVAAGTCGKCLVQIAYVIGKAEPVSVYVNTQGTSKVGAVDFSQLVREIFALQPKDIMAVLDLCRPIYRETAAYGHFGRAQFPWEKLDHVDKIKEKIFS